MRKFWKIGVMFAGLAGLGACTTASLEELRTAQPSGSPFQMALAREYLAFAESEARQYDWGDSKYFADKGLMAVYGKDVQPEDIARWEIDEQYHAELTQARAALTTALLSGHTARQPELAARTQFFYDCWVEQQEEAWQEEDITSCKEGFYRSLKGLEGAPVKAEAPAAEAMPVEEPTAPEVFSTSYLVFFEWAQWVLNAEAETIVDGVARDVLGYDDDYEVVLHGHADRSGTTEYNLKLSQKRAETVKTALMKRGVPAEKIRYFAFGESDNRIPTLDGIRNKANRRVEIFFNQ